MTSEWLDEHIAYYTSPAFFDRVVRYRQNASSLPDEDPSILTVFQHRDKVVRCLTVLKWCMSDMESLYESLRGPLNVPPARLG